MSKKRIIMMGAAGLISFAGTFIFAWRMGAPKGEDAESKQLRPAVAGEAGEEIELKLPLPETGTISSVSAGDIKMTKAMTEKQLKRLVYEVREKMQEYENKLGGLEVRQQRLQIAGDLIKKDIEELNNLRVELASMVARVKAERDKLLESRVEIAKAERDNLISIAATYDKMDSSSAAKILSNMCAEQMQSGRFEGGSLDDAVKILRYMAERTKAKLLAELVTSEPKLAAVLCQRLKQITQEGLETQ